jgi:hypothetical protein
MQPDLNGTDSLEFRACGPINTQLQELDNSVSVDIEALDEDVSTRELNILLLLASEAVSKDSQAVLSFQGIKMKLNLHQQKITKALKRLIKKNLIKKTLNGYSLSKKGMQIINSLLNSPDTSFKIPGQDYVGIELKIPINNSNNKLFNLVYLLKGRWFSQWRWIGMFENSESIKMEWQSLSGNLEACLCINETTLCFAVFDKNSTPCSCNRELLDIEFDKFSQKIQKIMNIDLATFPTASRAMIITQSSCNKSQICSWLTNYA